MSIKLELEIPDVNTILEGLVRVQENAGRVQHIVRAQASEQVEAQQKAAQAAAEDQAGSAA